MGMIDAAEQEIEEYTQKIDDIQFIFNNPVDDNNIMTYDKQQEDLQWMQELGLEKIK